MEWLHNCRFTQTDQVVGHFVMPEGLEMRWPLLFSLCALPPSLLIGILWQWVGGLLLICHQPKGTGQNTVYVELTMQTSTGKIIQLMNVAT